MSNTPPLADGPSGDAADVADDHKTFADLLSLALSSEPDLDCVGTAGSAAEAVAMAAELKPDIVVMDIEMPRQDGLAATRVIRAAETAGRRVTIVALTGNAMPGDREACVAAGMDDYLAKPFSLTALRTTIDRWAGTASTDASRLAARNGR